MINRKNISIAVVLLFTVFFCLIESINNRVTSDTTGAPAGHTGSPGDLSLTCTACHAGPAPTFKPGWITSNIPPSGYVPGSQYTITATIISPGHVKTGFQISPQDALGNKLGTLIITNAIQTKLVGSGGYATHTTGGTATVGGQKTWTFDWVAPSAGTGNVTFYGAFCATNNGGNSTGDTTLVSTLLVSECQVPLQPSAIIGNANKCSNTVDTFKVFQAVDAVSYQWTLPPGWTGTSADTMIIATIGPTGGSIIVNAVNSCGLSIDRTLAVSVTNVITSVSSTTPLTCPGGSNASATASASNGAGPYSYSWNTIPVQSTNIATGLSAGIYIVTATDIHGCIDTALATIIDPPAININSSITHSACQNINNGSATASVVSGGTGPFTYSWNTTPVQNTQSAVNLSAGTYIVTATDFIGCTNTKTVIVPQSPNLGVTMTNTPVTCPGGSNGSVNASPAGGIRPFTYLWNTFPVQTDSIATGLMAGNYSVIVTDSNGCIANGLSVLSQPPAISVATSFNNVLCFGTSTGNAFASATGGTGAFTYSWNTTPVQNNDTAVGLPIGTYTVTVIDSNSCSSTSSVTITQPTALSASTTPGITSCFAGHDGSATITGIGGTTPYSFLWNTIPVQFGDTANNLFAGTYSVTVTDNNGCTFATSATVTQPTAITVTTTSSPAHCYGENNGTATATPAGGTGPYTYLWNTIALDTNATAINLFAGNYSVTITDFNGCTKTSSVNVNQPSIINLQTTTTTANCLQNNATASVIASGGVPGYTFSWSTVPTQTGPTATNLLAGIYAVTATDSIGCMKDAFVVINNSTGMVLNVVSITRVSCYGLSDGGARVLVTNASGPLTYTWLPTHDTLPIITGLPAGLVSITVVDTSNCQVSEIISIPEPSPLVAVPGSKYSICAGDSIMIGATPGASGGTLPYSYSWTPSSSLSSDSISNPLASPGATSLFTMTISDSSGCTSSLTDTVTVKSIPVPLVLNFNDTLFCTPAPFYQWFRNDTLIPGAVSNFYPLTQSGDYSVIVTDTNGCSTVSATIAFILSTSEVLKSDLISIYPNPASGELSIVNNYKAEKTIGTLMTIQGLVLSTMNLNVGMNKLDVRNLPNGNYIFHISNSENHIGKIITIIN